MKCCPLTRKTRWAEHINQDTQRESRANSHYTNERGCDKDAYNLYHRSIRQIQFLGYNSELHSNLSEAIELRESSGLVAIAILVQLANQSHSDFRHITSQLHKITYRGMK